ncbi:unnamed protein product [Effrenium voratum]|nr:unnamed protein product [Effrenium voratum]
MEMDCAFRLSLCAACCCCLTIGFGSGFFAAGRSLQKAKDSGSTCGGYKAGTMPSQTPPVFLTEQIAVCPGTYWCSKEGEMCSCKGEITYSAELFDGYVYTVPSAEMTYKVSSDGTWKCGTDQEGRPFAVDPAPWRVKHCWCTPDDIQAILKPYGTSLHKKECSETTNFDFESVRRLQVQRRLFTKMRERLAAKRQLATSARRRRTYRYTPWALVTIDKDSWDTEAEPKSIACAYEYGVPQASGMFYSGDGAYSGDVWAAEGVAKDWGVQPSRTCWIRTAGSSRGESCAVAMVMPGEMKEKAEAGLSITTTLFWMGFLCTVILGVAGGTMCYMYTKPAGPGPEAQSLVESNANAQGEANQSPD